MTSRPTRRQATLFLRGRRPIEDFRDRFNPEQSRLIDAHVTLCREDEVDDWPRLSKRLRGRPPGGIDLEFGEPVRQRDLLYLPCLGSTAAFDEVRAYLLGRSVRKHEPHITLIHPRNGKCTDEILEMARSLIKPFSHTFVEISLIEQTAGGIWRSLERFSLNHEHEYRDGISH
ncbi:MAG: 2'-5' RNA ligase family protein [Pyrinomonadaceae bacterium]|nr:2'-5' RNA ligase family protein [Pyrinomonadaceae bacterium]